MRNVSLSECYQADCVRAFKFSMPAQEMCSGVAQDTVQGNPNLMEEDKPVLHGVNIRAATPDRLVQLCVESFGKIVLS